MGLVVVTRPEPDASDYAGELKAAGFDVFVEPMLEIEALDFERPDLSQYNGVLLTSANAARIPADGFDGMVYCVGKHTAQAAKQAGFQNIVSVNGTGVDLFEHLLSLSDVKSQRFLHVCGEHVAFPLVQRLSDAGIETDCLRVYRSKYAEQLSDDFVAALRDGQVNAITFFSKRTAEAFIKNVGVIFSESESESIFAGIKVLSISEPVVECVRVLPWGASKVSKTPDRDGMMQLLKAYV